MFRFLCTKGVPAVMATTSFRTCAKIKMPGEHHSGGWPDHDVVGSVTGHGL